MGATQRLARITGALYLIVGMFGMFAAIASTSPVVAGDAAATAANLLAAEGLYRAGLVSWLIVLMADVAVGGALYILLRPVNGTVALVAAAFRIVYSAMQGFNLSSLFDALSLLAPPGPGAGLDAERAQALALRSLEAFGTGFLVGLVFFGSHLLLLGYLFCTSRYVPRVFGVRLVAGGIGYVADSLGKLLVSGYSPIATAVLLAPAVVGEFGLLLWLRAKGPSGNNLASRDVVAYTGRHE